MTEQNAIWPRPLKPGDTVALVAPSGAMAHPETLPEVVKKIEEAGFTARVYPSCRAQYGYLSGDDVTRANDLNDAFADDAIDGIFCLRGGYGTPRIMDKVDFLLARKHPKVFLGYSDITALHIAYNQIGRLVTFHGAMPATWIDPAFEGFTRDNLMAALSGRMVREISNPSCCPPARGHNGGTAQGALIGGNLTLAASLVGTPWDIDARGKILFLEDVGEYTYRLDRLFTQLRLAGKFDICAGVVLGTYTECEEEYPDRALSLAQIVRDVVLPCGKPVLTGVQAGHCAPKITLPLGAQCMIDADAGILRLAQEN